MDRNKEGVITMEEVFLTERFVAFKAAEEDIPYVMEQERGLDNRDFVFQYSFEQHKKLLSSKSAMLLIIKDKISKDKIGFIIYELNRDSDSFELRRIVIDPKGQGAGKEIIKGLINYAFTNLGINRLWLDVFSDNTRAIHLYKTLGMTHEGTLRQGYKDYKGLYRDQLIFSILREEYKAKS
jgi:RimJ/RimL family protein N-acetyltransferase